MEELKELKQVLDVVKDHSASLTLGGAASFLAIGAVLVKFHKKIVGDPLKSLSTKISKLDQKLSKEIGNVKSDSASADNRIDEIDRLLNYQGKRLDALAKEEKESMSKIVIVELDVDRIKQAIKGSNIDIGELKESWRIIRDLDTATQVAIARLETILSGI